MHPAAPHSVINFPQDLIPGRSRLQYLASTAVPLDGCVLRDGLVTLCRQGWERPYAGGLRMTWTPYMLVPGKGSQLPFLGCQDGPGEGGELSLASVSCMNRSILFNA